MKEVRITQEGSPETKISVSPVYRDRPLSVALARAGFVLNTRCGQKGLCKSCEVRLESGEWIKACQVPAFEAEGMSIHIPERSLLRGSLSVAVDFQPRCAFELNPLFPVEGFRNLGLCIDIGTTTVVMGLVDLGDGKIIGRSSSYNAQVRIGEDVLTRIEACTHSIDAVVEGQRLMLETLTGLWEELMELTGCSGDQLTGCIVAGNTTMLHFFLGADPSPMGRVPFKPVFLDVQTRPHREIPFNASSWEGADSIPWQLLPGCSAYVGADIVAGWLASGMADQDGTHLLVDMGTNGEILLQHEGRLTACATAAGPAFEGTQLSWGTRAIEGAVSRIHGNLLEPVSLQFEYVTSRGNKKSPGFCGSAYIDFMALGIQCGLLQGNGRFDREVAGARGIPLGQGKFGYCWYLNPGDRESPSISEADIALLLQAKAAIAAGIDILLGQSGLGKVQVGRVYLAGGFGMNLGIDSAITCGLLSGFSKDQVEVVGNSALGGAYVCLLDRERAGQLAGLNKRVRVLELNEDPEFEDTFIDHLQLSRPES